MFTEYLNTLSEYSPLSDVTKSQLEPYISVKNLNKDELNEIADENGNIKVICEFCKMERSFNYGQ